MFVPDLRRSISDLEDPTATMSYPYTSLPDGDQPTGAPTNLRQLMKGFFIILSGLLVVGLMIAFLGGNGGLNPGKIERGVPFMAMAGHSVPEKSDSPGVLISEKSEQLSTGVNDLGFPWDNNMLSWQRTSYHFQPEKNWMNDPNGPMFYKGWYHFFYQCNPKAAVWANLSWGHSVSKDLINWHHLPLALVPDQWYDINGVWSGSATLLPDGKVVMLYTGITNESVQFQNLAYPANSSDPFLIDWVKYPNNPVLVPPPGIQPDDFRDPSTAWLTPDNKWRIVIGSKINKSGVSFVYDTDDFEKFDLIDGVLHEVSDVGMWECVDFYPVSTSSENGLDTSTDGSDVKHVLKVSMIDVMKDYYAIGIYDHNTTKWIPDDPSIDLGHGLRPDYGIFYASKTFYDQNKKRRVLWAWIMETGSESTNIKKGWASLQGVPRTVLYDLKTRSNLIQWPVEEIENLRKNVHEFNNVDMPVGSIVPLDIGQAAQLDIVAEFEINKEDLKRVVEESKGEEYTCTSSGGAAQRGALGPFGVLVLADENLTEKTAVYFYIAKGNDGNLKTYFCSDLSRSSEANDVDKQIYGGIVPVLNGEKLTMRILVDHSIVECFAQGGRTCITSRVYPTKAIYGATRVFLFNNATSTRITTSIKIWHMDSAVFSSYSHEMKE